MQHQLSAAVVVPKQSPGKNSSIPAVKEKLLVIVDQPAMFVAAQMNVIPLNVLLYLFMSTPTGLVDPADNIKILEFLLIKYPVVGSTPNNGVTKTDNYVTTTVFPVLNDQLPGSVSS